MFLPKPFHERRPGLVAPVPIDLAGVAGPTPGQARGPRWRQAGRGLHVPADVPLTAQQRTVEAGAVLRDDEAVTGWAALHWAGARWFDGTTDGVEPRDVPLVAKRHLVAQPGFSVSQEFLHPNEIEVVDHLPITRAQRSVVFELRYAAGLGDEVVALDMACYSGETQMRGGWTKRAGLPRPLCNRPVFTLDGRHVGTPDLIDPVTELAGLYHGSDHLTLADATTDLAKDAAYRDVGLEPVTMLATDWSDLDLDGFVSRLRAAAARARRRRAPRAWTIEPPAWWTPTHTVARRRALAGQERARFLGYRRAA